jgi:hypothetical protein
MSPTNELRYILRPVPVSTAVCLDWDSRVVKLEPFLQQKWVEEGPPYALSEPLVEWRDVPTVQEDE